MMFNAAVRSWMVLAAVLLGATSAVALAADVLAAPDRATAVSPFRTVEPGMELRLIKGQSQLLRTAAGFRRTALDASGVIDVVQTTPTEILVMGKKSGDSQLMVWTGDGKSAPVVIEVHVAAEK
jgi:Flp pilus assembly secretin CpaC